MLHHVSSALLAVLPYITIPDGRLGPLPIHPFGLLVATGIVVGHRMAMGRARVLGLDENRFESLVFWTVATGIVLSHMLDQIFYHPEVLRDRPWELFMIHHGLSSFGGFFGAAIGFAVYSHRHKVDVWRSADAIAYGLPVGWLFGRAGCSIVHDHPGRLSTHWAAVNYPPPHVPVDALHKFAGIFRINPAGAEGMPRFDLGIAEFALTPLLIGMVLLLAAKTRRPGALVGTLATVYPIIRFPLDFLRATDPEGGDVRYFGLTPGQYACVLCLGLGIWILRRTAKLPAEPPPSEGKKKPPQEAPAAAS